MILHIINKALFRLPSLYFLASLFGKFLKSYDTIVNVLESIGPVFSIDLIKDIEFDIDQVVEKHEKHIYRIRHPRIRDF